jgi:hypothetical protein
LTDAPLSAGLVVLAARIELWSVEKLRPYERNPRTHSEAQVDQIAASMVEFGWTNPVLVDEQGGILAGHGRLLAARKLGLNDVPVIQFEHLSETQKRAYLIADNQLALQAGWSEELLASELAWLRDESFDLDLIGFDATELERLLAIADGEAGSEEAEDEVPEPPEEPVSKPGDLWILGNHRLLCGNATIIADVERVLGGQLADMTWTDPPYNVHYANTPKDKLRGKHRPILNDNLGGGFEAFLLDACTNTSTERERFVTQALSGLSADATAQQRREVEELAGALYDEQQVLQARQRLMDEGRSITDRTRTATEQYAVEIEKLSELLAAGAIDQQTYARAVEDANDRTLRSSHAWTDGATRFLKDYVAESQDAASATERAFGQAFSGAEDATVTASHMIREAVGVFHDRDTLQNAVEDLLKAGFDRSEISLLAGEQKLASGTSLAI